MKICPIAYENCQSWLKIYPNTKLTLNISLSTCKILPKWQNFAKFGHSAGAGEI